MGPPTVDALELNVQNNVELRALESKSSEIVNDYYLMMPLAGFLNTFSEMGLWTPSNPR